jgi:DNA-binding winged helix-turn-helix (wHTH) protein/Tol biopolymer transport system component
VKNREERGKIVEGALRRRSGHAYSAMQSSARQSTVYGSEECAKDREGSMSQADHPIYEVGEFRLDPQRRLLTRSDGAVVTLTPKAFDALVHLAEHAGELVTRAALTDVLWPSTVVEENNLSQQISLLRRALGAGYIATVARRGYQLTAPVAELHAGRPDPAAPDPDPRGADPQPAMQQDWINALRRRPIAWAAIAAGIAVAAVFSVRTPAPPAADPFERSVFTKLTEFPGSEEQAAISRDGRFVSFLRERGGEWDVWVSQIGSGDFENLTNGSVRELRNPAVRTLSFLPDGSRVLLWTKTLDPADGGTVDGGWAVPVVGGALQPWYRGIAELDWSSDGKRVVYHTAEPGDPLYVARTADRGDARQIFAAAAGVHSHFPLWSRDGEHIYFVHGVVPDEMDLWRIRASGGTPERLTQHNSRVASPAQLDERPLLYLATATDGSGPWLHALDLEHGTTRRLNTSGQAYTSIAASADGARLVATVVQSTSSLWRLSLGIGSADTAIPLEIDLPRAAAPRLGPEGLAFRAPKGGVDGVFVLADGKTTELWNGADGRVIAGPVPAPDGRELAFTVQRGERFQLYAMRSDGTGVRRLAETLDVRGAPAWSPDGGWIAIGALREGTPQLFKVPATGGAPITLGTEYGVDPAWSPSGDFIVFSGADVGTNFTGRAVNADGTPHALPQLVLARGPRRLDILSEHELVLLRGDLSYKELWLVDLSTGAERPLTALGDGATIADFDVAPDGSAIVLERTRDESDIALIDLLR